MKLAKILVFLWALALSSVVSAWEVLPEHAVFPADNPYTEAKAELGKQLYFDKRLSKTGTIACQSCHDVMGNGTDSAPVSTGVLNQKGTRNAPTVWNAAFWTVQFWDGRARSLEDQAKGPMVNPVEMGMASHDVVVARITKIPGYRKEFQDVFGGDTPITIDNVAKAIATYERTLITPDSAYDRYLKGDKNAMGPQALSGMKLVKEIGCISCHGGPQFNGPQTLTGFYMKFPLIPGSKYEKEYDLTSDLGRYNATKNEGDKNFWRVPSWRNVAVTGPYFHNGKVKTLDEAVRVMAKAQLARDLTRHQVTDIVAFLKTLTGKMPKQEPPKLPAD